MLNKIKSIGLSIVIGSMIIVSVPTMSFADDKPILSPEVILSKNNIPKGEYIMDIYGHVYDYRGIHVGNQDKNGKIKLFSKSEIEKNEKKNATKKSNDKTLNILMSIYKNNNVGRFNKNHEKLVKKYYKNKELKDMAKKDAKEDMKLYKKQDKKLFTDVYISSDKYGEFEEIFDSYSEMSREEQLAIATVYSYYYNKEFKSINSIEHCNECQDQFITHKNIFMYGYSDCGCYYNKVNKDIQVPKLTVQGVIAAWNNSYGYKPKLHEETEDAITIVINDFMDKRYITFDKHTRKVVKDITVEE